MKALLARIEMRKEKPMKFCYELALKRLSTSTGEEWMRKRPHSELDLRMMREKVIDLISQPSPPAKMKESKQKREASPVKRDSGSEEGSSRTRFTALTPELQAGAVASGVAKRLHKGIAHLAFTPGSGRPKDGANAAPQTLREGAGLEWPS